MDRCITKTIIFEEKSKTLIKYNFKYLNWTEEIIDENGKENFNPMVPCLVRKLKIFFIKSYIHQKNCLSFEFELTRNKLLLSSHVLNI